MALLFPPLLPLSLFMCCISYNLIFFSAANAGFRFPSRGCGLRGAVESPCGGKGPKAQEGKEGKENGAVPAGL